MNATLALLLCIGGVAGLFYFDRDNKIRTSAALWLPVAWIGVSASRPVSMWFGQGSGGPSAQLDGTPLDAAFYGALMLGALAVLIRRSRAVRVLLTANRPIVLYFLFSLISVVWSAHTGVALKRWIKATGDLAMVCVVVTDRQSVAAFERLVSRLGLLLLPISVVLIKYYPLIGRGYAPDGMQMNTGITTNKNILGVTVLVIAMGTLWHVLTLWRDRARSNRRRYLWVHGSLLACSLLALKLAGSATSLACFFLGGGILLASRTRLLQRKPARIHALCAGILLVGVAVMFFGGQGEMAHALGRQSNFSGRTDIWAAVIPAVPNALVGAGFESFWISPSVQIFQHTLQLQGWWHPEGLNEAHDGYLEVYLNLGWVGVALIAGVLLGGYSRAVKAYRKNPSVGGLMIGYIVVAMVYNVTEAGFRMMDPIWVFLLLAIVTSAGVVTGVFRDGRVPKPAPKDKTERSAAAERTTGAAAFSPAPATERSTIAGSIF